MILIGRVDNLLRILYFAASSSDVDIQAILVNDLLNNYSKITRPVFNTSMATVVTHQLIPIQILNVDERNQVITVKVWVELSWNDELLRWNASDYGELDSVHIPISKLWQPDITLYESVASEFERHFSTDVQVQSDGTVSAPQPMVYHASCPIDATYFPFDQQECDLKFGSWSYDGSLIDLEIDPTSGSLSNYIPNGEWNLLTVPIIKHAVYYTCCPEPYPDITYTLVMRRRSLFYIYTLLVPVMLMFIVIFVGFYLPTECGERMTIFVTSMLSLIVFLTVASEYLPPTSETTPFIQKYVISTIGLVALSSVLTGFTVNLHYQSHDCAPVPRRLRTIVFKYLAVVVFMRRKTRFFLEKADNIANIKSKELNNALNDENTAEIDKVQTSECSNNTIYNNDNIREWQMLASVFDRLFLLCYIVAFTFLTGGIFIYLGNRNNKVVYH
ncbi:neuronal acetylcholine receptor subunit alpha-9-II-like [Saccoglossus kowalevskii]